MKRSFMKRLSLYKASEQNAVPDGGGMESRWPVYTRRTPQSLSHCDSGGAEIWGCPHE